jgi:hypothetical protein
LIPRPSLSGGRQPAANSRAGIQETMMARQAVKFEIPDDAPRGTCSGCAAAIAWISTATGKRMPVDADGTSHFATCPKAAHFRRAAPRGGELA